MNNPWPVGVALLSSVLASASVRARNAAPAGLTGQAVLTHQDTLTRKVHELCAELGALGLTLPSEGLAVELLAPAEFEAGLAREHELVFGAGHAEQLRFLRQALTLDAGREVVDLRARLAHSAAQGVNCRYDFEHGKLTVLAPAAEAATNDESALAHELARAWRDQQSDLVAWFGAAPRTTEMARARQCTLEGEAGAAALALIHVRSGKSLDKLRPEAAYGLATAATGDTALRLARVAGRDRWLRAMREQGAEAREQDLTAQGLWSSPPTSTEQILHATKHASDLPRAVELPTWPEKAGVAEVLHEDTLGELELLALLLDAGVARGEAELAALGWDGDRMQLLRGKSGEYALVWRIVFDRGEDARQFATAWAREALGQMGATGPVFDWVRSDSVRLSNLLGEALHDSVPRFAPEAGDRSSTEELERAVQLAPENPPRVEGDRWLHPRYGFSMPVPTDWNAEQINGQVYLVGKTRGDFRDLIGVVAIENPGRSELAALLDQHRGSIANNEQAKLVLAEQRKLGGKDVIYLRYDVTPDASKPLHMTSVVFLSGAKQVIVSATISDADWSAQAPEIEKALSGILFNVSAKPPAGGGR